MNEFNTFFITSTINVSAKFEKKDFSQNLISTHDRATQTLGTIQSIRAKDKNAKIVLVDNSIKELDSKVQGMLTDNCDLFVKYPHTMFSKFCNETMHFQKSMGEILLTEEFIRQIKQHNLVGKRIFKITGRYQLSDTFDIGVYSNPIFENKYVFKPVVWYFEKKIDKSRTYKTFFETKFWSFCGSLVDEYQNLLPNIFEKIIVDGNNIESAHLQLIPVDKRVEIENLCIEGCHPNGAFISL